MYCQYTSYWHNIIIIIRSENGIHNSIVDKLHIFVLQMKRIIETKMLSLKQTHVVDNYVQNKYTGTLYF